MKEAEAKILQISALERYQIARECGQPDIAMFYHNVAYMATQYLHMLEHLKHQADENNLHCNECKNILGE